jgi:hypothetical protein
MPVFNPMRLIGSGSLACFPVCFIFGVVAVKKEALTLPFKGQDVGDDAIQKPAVMADDQGTSAEKLQGFFQGSHGIDIQIIGRFIQKKHIGPFF